MDATTTPFKSFSTPRLIMDPVPSQTSHHIFKGIHHYTPTTYSSHLLTCGHSIFDPLTPKILHRTNRHPFTRQYQTSHIISSMTAWLETAHPFRRTQSLHASRDYSIRMITCHSISQIFAPIQRPAFVLLTSSGHLIMVHQTCC